MSNNIPIIKKTVIYCQKTTAIKVKIQGVFDFLEKKEIKTIKDNFEINSVFHVRNYKI